LQKLPAEIQALERIRILEEQQKKKDEENAALMKKVEELEAKINGGAVTNNVTIVNNVVINNFNTPNVEHLYEFEKFTKLLATEKLRLPIALLFETYFDPRHPENECIHLLDDHTRRVIIRLDNRWIQFPMDKALEELRNIGYHLVANGVRKYDNEHIPAEQKKAIRRYIDIIARYRPQKYDYDAEKADKREIEEKLIAEYPASQAHPAVVAERARMKAEIVRAKKGL
jgi:hypothetical protein